MGSDSALLYVSESEPCEELKEKLLQFNVKFVEWKVNPQEIESPLPLRITGNGVYTKGQILAYGKYLPKIIVQR